MVQVLISGNSAYGYSCITIQSQYSQVQELNYINVLMLDGVDTLQIEPFSELTHWGQFLLAAVFALSIFLVLKLFIGRIQVQRNVLERKVIRRIKEVSKQKAELELQSKKLQEAYEEIKVKNQAIEEAFQHLTGSFAKLKDLNQFKESMIAMIVHDFKNSLNTIISFSDGNPTPRRMKSIHQAGRSMLNMVLNMLDVQKFEATKVKLAYSNHYIRDVIQEALDQMESLIEQSNIKVILLLEKYFSCRLDYEMSVRVIANILSNAIKYSPVNGEIKIEARSLGDFVEVTIADEGIGIPENKLTEVFDKYTQVAPKSGGRVRSTGIGLAFCKMMIEAYKGEIKAESKEGEWSKFYLQFPLLEEKASAVIEMDKNGIPKFEFTGDEKQLMAPVLHEFKKWEVYDYSELEELLSRDNHYTGSLSDWKDKMTKAIQNVNEEEYSRLITALENG